MKHLIVTEEPPKPKTLVWSLSNRHGEDMGKIAWYPRWRGYCYEIEGVVYSRGCLRDILEFLEEHKNDRVGSRPR